MTERHPDARLRPHQLLRIDIDAQLHNLCEAQLPGVWQVPAELVRHALACGASWVDVVITRRGFTVTYHGVNLGHQLIAGLAHAFDTTQGPWSRQRAIADLERTNAQALLWASLGGRARLRIRTQGRDGSELVVGKGRSAQVRRCSSDAAPGTVVETVVRGFAHRRAIRWLWQACAFAGTQVRVNGTRVPQRFPDGLFRMKLGGQLEGFVAVTAEGKMPRLYLLHQGVVLTRATVPGYPALHAALELGSLLGPGAATPSRAREAVAPVLPELFDQGAAMLVMLAAQLPTLDPRARQRVRVLAFKACELGLRRTELAAVPMVEAHHRRGGRWLSLDELETLVARGTLLFALEPGEEMSHLPHTEGPLLLLSSQERAGLCTLLGTSLHAPVSSRPNGVLRRLLGSGVRRAVTLLRMIASPVWQRLLAPDELSTEEQGFLTLARSYLRSPEGRDLEVGFVRGRGAVVHHRWGVAHRLSLPRRQPEVIACVQAAARGTQWLYPALVALVDDVTMIRPSLHTQWIRTMVRPRPTEAASSRAGDS